MIMIIDAIGQKYEREDRRDHRCRLRGKIKSKDDGKDKK
jgi:hypothetical protein